MFFNLNDKNRILKFYNLNGYAVIKDFYNKELISNTKKYILKDIKKVEKEFTYYEKINNKRRLRRVEKICNHSKYVQKVINSKRIKDLLFFLTKKKNILFKDKLNFKYPGGKGYLPHIDGHFYWKDKNNIIQKGWGKYSNSFTNIVIPLETSDVKNGCLFVSKKKNIKKLGNTWKKITDKLIKNSPNIKKKDLKKFDFNPAILNPGNILIFDWHCAHKSLNNNSKLSRMIFYATYCSKIANNKNVRFKYYYDKKFSLNDNLIKSLQF